jgi:adenylate cyclase
MTGFRSIRTRLMTAVVLLVVAVVAVVVWVWTADTQRLLRVQKQTEARSFAVALANAFMNELDDENWSQIRIAAELLLKNNRDFVYVIVSDRRLGDRIVAAAPAELADQYVPDLVPLVVTRGALAAAAEPRSVETWLLRDVTVAGTRRATRGERIVEVAADVRIASNQVVGTLRVGLSLASVDAAVDAAVRKALGIGALALVVGLAGAWILAGRMANPVRKLQASAAQIANGDLAHRAEVIRSDEIGALANAFNDMTSALEHSFARLRRTLESFERFVPQKFLQVIAPGGVENIQVGVARERRISVLFADIRSYTRLSEGMVPLEVFNFLNQYLARMGQAISGCGGFIDKYIGDAIMALFDDEATDGVLDAALAMRRTLAEFNAERAARGQLRIEIGIGIHGGEVAMGTIGFTSKIESTVVGDAVNVASRVQSLTKEYGATILVTDTIVAGLRERGRFTLRLVASDLKVRGKEETIEVYALEG